MTVNTSEDLPRPLFSRFYAKVSPGMEAEGMADLRRELLAPMTGEVVEVGAGNGLNFAHYPPTVTELLAVEPEPYLRALAETAAQQLPSPSAWSTAPPMPCPVPMPAWTPPSHRWCCARCPTKPAPWLNCAGWYASGA
jgi:hypothetical protein